MPIQGELKRRLISKRLWGLVIAVAIWGCTAWIGGWELSSSSPVMIFLGSVFATFMTAEGLQRAYEARSRGRADNGP